MKSFLQIGFLSIALSQSLYAIEAQSWWELDEANYTDPKPPTPTITDPLRIFENSTLNLTTTLNPENGGQFFNGSILFDHDLTINLTTQGREGTKTTSIYRLRNAGERTFSGGGILRVNINATEATGEQIFDILSKNARLNIGVKTYITTTPDSQIFSIMRNAGGTVNFTNDLIVDLSNATGRLDDDNPNNMGITQTKAIFDNTENGTINVNPLQDPSILVQLTGDLATYVNSTTNINLSNSNSFFRGKLELTGGPTTFNLSGGSYAKLDIHVRRESARVFLNANHSTLYADFTYHNNVDPQGDVSLTNAGIWFLGRSNSLSSLTLNNDETAITRENLKSLSNLSAVDFRFQNEVQREFSPQARYTLTANSIGGSNGIFRMSGALNTLSWERRADANGGLLETVATDQIITGQLFNTHYIQLFWNTNNFDKSLLNKNLEDKKIIVAKQTGLQGGSNFVGALTPIGLYNYVTNLKKELYMGDNGIPAGWQWIVSDVQRADNSYLSKLLDSLFQSQFRIYRTQMDTLNLRMGELREMQRVHGVWLRSKYGRLGSKPTDQTAASWDEFASIWLGYDQNFYVLGGKNFLGVAFDVNFFNSNGIPEEKDFSNPSYIGQSQSYGFSVYDTFFFDNGFYIDALAKYYFTRNKFIINSEVLAGNVPKFFTHHFFGSLEIGKKFRLPIKTPNFNRSFYYLKPDFTMNFAFSSGQDWTFKDWSNQNIRARLDFNVPVSLRTGLSFGRQFEGYGYKGDVYLGTSFEYDFNTGGDLRLEDFLDRLTLTHRGNFNWRINAGTNVILNEYWRLYFDVDTSFFGTINSTFTINAGVRINFGRLHPQMPYIPPYIQKPQSQKRFFDRRTIPEVQNYETEGILDNYNPKRKVEKFPPKVFIQQNPYQQERKQENLKDLSITPKVDQKPKGNPLFIDDPQEVPIPTQNYKRDNNTPIYPQQGNRSMDTIKGNLNRGFR